MLISIQHVLCQPIIENFVNSLHLKNLMLSVLFIILLIPPFPSPPISFSSIYNFSFKHHQNKLQKILVERCRKKNTGNLEEEMKERKQ